MSLPAIKMGFPGGTSGKEPACHSRRPKTCGSILESGRAPGGGHGNSLQYSCLENPMDRGAWRATVHGVSKSQTQLKRLRHRHTCGRKVCSGLFCGSCGRDRMGRPRLKVKSTVLDQVILAYSTPCTSFPFMPL